MNKDLDLKEFYKNSEANIVDLPHGEKAVGDLVGFYKVVDFFASQYGLGGCVSLEDFAEMINTSDPVLLKCMQLAAEERIERQWGTGDDKDKTKEPDKEEFIPETHTPEEPDQEDSEASVVTSGNGKIRRFLKTWGADSKDLTKAKNEVELGKIKLKDYSWVDKDNLMSMSPERFRKLKKDIVTDNEKSINFKVSMETMNNKAKDE